MVQSTFSLGGSVRTNCNKNNKVIFIFFEDNQSENVVWRSIINPHNKDLVYKMARAAGRALVHYATKGRLRVRD